MRGDVLIIWGGNQNLAQTVADKLRRHGFSAQIGGGSQKNTYIGTQVIDQIQRADKIIVLVQWPPEDTSEVDLYKVEFRPNLMYEWGYVNAKFPPEDVQVFVIGFDQSALPSDLKGCWVNEVPFNDIQQMSEAIVDTYIEKESAVEINHHEIFISWNKTKQYLQSIIESGETYNNVRLANMLLHSIQPAYYNYDITFLKQIVTQLRGSNRELNASKEIVSAICDFYEITQNQLSKSSIAELKTVRDLLEFEVEVGDEGLKLWLNVLRLDFLGLCNMFIGESERDQAAKEYYLRMSLENFSHSYEMLLQLNETAETAGYVLLWKGYILRNYGKILSDLDMTPEGSDKLSEALKCRKMALRFFRSHKTPELLLTHLELETNLVEIDLMRYGYVKNEIRLKETIESLKRFNKPFDLWKLVILEARSISEHYNDNTELLTEIDRLYGLIK